MEGQVQQEHFMIVLLEILLLMSLTLGQLTELLFNLMFVRKNVETEDISIKTVVTMGTGTTGMVVIDSVMLNLDGFVWEVIEINLQDVQKSAEMDST